MPILGLYMLTKVSLSKLTKHAYTSRNQPKRNQSIYDYMRLDLGILQLQDQISTILVIFTTMMQLLEISSYWLDQFYIYFHPLIS
jgi:hypothetical protein